LPDPVESESLFVRLYLDHHIKAQLAEDLRVRGYDVLTASEAGMEAASDEDQLALAANENRALLTFNIRHFAALHQRRVAAGRSHAGIIVSRQLGSREYRALLSRVLRLLDRVSAAEIRGMLVHLEQFKE